MNIAVCLCQVPDSASVIGFADGVLDRSRINEVMNPYDEYALEEAVRIKERIEGSSVTVFCVARFSAQDMLRKALALGSDRAVLVSSASEPSDPYQTALYLSRALLEFYSGDMPDLVFCGKQATDFQHAEVPAMLGALLDIPSVSGVTALHLDGGQLSLEREIEGGVEQIELYLPAVLSAEKGLNQPRKTNIKAVMEARKKTIESMTVSVEVAPLVLMTGIVPLKREKVCRFVRDEKELVTLLGMAGSFF